jgi:hypothetical protein
VEYNSGTLAYTKLDNKPSISIGILFRRQRRKKKRRNLVADFAAVKYRKAYRVRRFVSLIVENKRSISHNMVDDAIEDAREQLSDQVEVLFRDENTSMLLG